MRDCRWMSPPRRRCRLMRGHGWRLLPLEINARPWLEVSAAADPRATAAGGRALPLEVAAPAPLLQIPMPPPAAGRRSAPCSPAAHRLRCWPPPSLPVAAGACCWPPRCPPLRVAVPLPPSASRGAAPRCRSPCHCRWLPRTAATGHANRARICGKT